MEEGSFLVETEHRVQRAQAGDEDELGLLMQEHLPFVRRIAALNLGRRLTELESIDDVVQGSLLRALKSLAHFSYTTRGSFRRWMAMVVENEVRDLARRHGALKRGEGKTRRMPELESRILADSVFQQGTEPTPSQAATAAETEDRIELALLDLPERERRAIVLRRLGEADYATVADDLELGSEGSARALVHRALAKLASRL